MATIQHLPVILVAMMMMQSNRGRFIMMMMTTSMMGCHVMPDQKGKTYGTGNMINTVVYFLGKTFLSPFVVGGISCISTRFYPHFQK